jgi:glucose dehydrogenase
VRQRCLAAALPDFFSIPESVLLRSRESIVILRIRALRTRVSSLLLACLWLASAPLQAQTNDRLDAGEWPVHGGDFAATRYSPLDQIDASNVGSLRVAWRWSAANFGPEPEFNYQTTPLMIDGVLYATAGSRRSVVAIDAATGQTLWTHRFDEGERGAVAPRVNAGRGVAFWEASGDETDRIFYITPGYRLFALDTSTGVPVSGFGDNGAVDLMASLRIPEGVDPIGTIGSSSPPIVVNDVVIMGSAHVSGRSRRISQATFAASTHGPANCCGRFTSCPRTANSAPTPGRTGPTATAAMPAFGQCSRPTRSAASSTCRPRHPRTTGTADIA